MHLESVRRRIADAAARARRDPAEVRIVAVTKTHPLSVVRLAAEAGLLDVGENRVQEALAKQAEWPDAPVRWHLIGHLQRNKAKLAAGRFALIHSLDSIRLADALEQAAAAGGLVQPVLVQVNVAGEEQKDGCALADAEALIAHAAGLPHLRLDGLMTMAPLTEDVGVIRQTFRGLRELSSRLPPAASRPVLSMGMSSDFEIAVEEGATMLRLGTVLFGERHHE
jgi:pyridoxal phosphate enzyme (YggS family)